MDKLISVGKMELTEKNVKGSCGVVHLDILEWKYCKECERRDRYRSDKSGLKFSRESNIDKDKLHLKSHFACNNAPKTNVMTFKHLPDGKIVIFLDNGKSRETGIRKGGSFMLERDNLKMLKQWLSEKG